MQSNLTQVLSQYPLKVKSVSLIADKGKKAAWSVSTSAGLKILKKAPSNKSRLLFLLKAVKHLQKNGAPIPNIVSTRAGRSYAQDGTGTCYVLSDSVSGKSPRYTDTTLVPIMKLMGKFHAASRGFSAPYPTGERSHLGKWEAGYVRHLERLESFKTAAARNGSEFAKLYLAHADSFIRQGKDALKWIQGDAYSKWVKKISAQKNLCHQDFAAGNLIQTGKGIYIIDMDSLTYDLPARDIRKIFNKVMKSTGWSADKAVAMLRAYHQSYPLTAEECRVIYADLLFPHLFYGLASKYFNKRQEWNSPKMLQKLKALVSSDKNRLQTLAAWDRIVSRALT